MAVRVKINGLYLLQCLTILWISFKITKWVLLESPKCSLSSGTNLLSYAVIDYSQKIPNNSKYLHLNRSGLGIVWVMTSLAVNQIFSRQANPRPPWAGNTLIPQFGLVSSRTFIIYMSWLIENFYHLHVTKFKLLEFILHPNKPIPLWGQFCLDAHNY